MKDSKELQKRVSGFQKDLIKLLDKYDAGLFTTWEGKCLVEFFDAHGDTEGARVICDEDEDIRINPNIYNYDYD